MAWVFRTQPSRRIAALGFLSVLFWGWVDYRGAVVLLTVSAWCFLVAHKVSGAPKRSLLSKRWCGVGVIGALVPLLLFKTLPEVGSYIAEVRGADSLFDRWWQPIGIAMLGLQAVSYIVDVYRDDSSVKPFNVVLVVCGFFPKAFAGPLVRTASFSDQLERPFHGEYEIEKIAVRVLSGCFKKYVLVETLLAFDGIALGSGDRLGAWDTFWHLLAGFVAFVVDVSAYTDIALAAGLLCGVKLPENFNAPFSGWTPSEVWRRWHMSVAGFFRDYVAAPLRGRSNSPWRQAAAVIVSILLLDLWHVASPGILLWGLLIAVPMAVEQEMGRRRALKTGKHKRQVRTGVARWARAVLILLYLSSIGQLVHGTGVQVAWQSVKTIANPMFATQIASWWVVGCILCGWMIGAGLFGWLHDLILAMFKRLPVIAVALLCAVGVSVARVFAVGGIPSFLYSRLG